MIGETIAHYGITEKLGEGGMGEVYRATDTRLGREVAIKVARDQFTERFEREARTVAALNHPNICHLYDVGPNYLVMELVEGAPLKGPLSLDKAIEYAGQILDALDAAHKKGITHRDLKPANILVTKQGIKLLDFGLAKQTAPLKEADVTRALTGQGQILGTLQYMSPEQLQGKEVDARSDLFSFGCVLYEMLTGKRAFEGKSPASVIAAILEREPAPLEVARPLDRVVCRSLAKDPDQRFQTARDLKAALSWVLEQPAASGASQRRSKLPWVVAGVLVLGIAGWAAWWRATRPTAQMLKPLVRLDVGLGPDVSLGSVSGTDVILSPDGTRLVYVSQGRLFTRQLNQSKATELAGTEGAFEPFFSPDGQWVAFFAQAKLKKVSVEGGAPISVSEAGGFARGGSWGDDENIIFALSVTSALSRVPSSGGIPTPLTELAQGEVTHRWPQVLPGSKAVLFTAASSANGSGTAKIEVMSLGSHHRKTLQRGGTFGRYLPSGHLVYVNSGTLFAVPFDLDRLEVHGTPSPVLQDIAISTVNASAQLDFSRTGTLVYRNGEAGSQVVNVQWLRASGQTEPLLPNDGVYFRPRVSPDGKRLALDVSAGSDEDIWAYELQRGTRTRLTFGGVNVGSVWSPDGRYTLFRVTGMFWTRSDGASKPQPLTQSENIQNPWSFTPDGKRLAFWEQDARTQGDLWTMAMESNGAGLQAGKREVFLQTPADERYPCFSPDGKWLAYTSDESGTYQIYVEAFPRKGGRWQISDNGGTYPVWSRNGRELFFRTSDSRIMVATYTAKGASFVPDKPRLWSDTRLADFGTVGIATYDLAPDGERIAAIMPAETAEAQQARNHVVFLLNFFDELRRRVPVGK